MSGLLATSPLASPLPTAAPSLTGSGQANPTNAADAARQFEALLIAQMLRTAHESSGGSFGDTGDDSSEGTMFDVAGQQFAQVMANNGGLGLAKMIVQGLDKK